DTPFPVHVKKTMPIEFVEKKEDEETEEIKFFLEEAEEKPVIKNEIEDSFEPHLKTDVQQPLFTEDKVEEEKLLFEEEELEIVAETETKAEEDDFPQTIMFSLDDDFEEEEKVFETEKPVFATQTTKPEAKQEVKKEIAPEDPFDSPISQSLSQAIEDRRARLKQFNYKFKNTLQNKSLDEVESVIAYKRQGMDLSERDRRVGKGGRVVCR